MNGSRMGPAGSRPAKFTNPPTYPRLCGTRQQNQNTNNNSNSADVNSDLRAVGWVPPGSCLGPAWDPLPNPDISSLLCGLHQPNQKHKQQFQLHRCQLD